MSTSLLRLALHALAIGLVAMSVDHANAAPTADPLPLSPGFSELSQAAPELVGEPVEAEHTGDNTDSTVVRTTSGLLYWEPGLGPSWTDGYQRLTLDDARQVVQWVGDALQPVIAPRVKPDITGGDWIDQRIYCIEEGESHHSAAPRDQYNPTPVWNGEHAQGFLGWLPSTAAHWGATIGNRASEWLAARHMLTSQPERFLRTQFAGIGSGAC